MTTDNDIIKALECLCGYALKCKECPYSPRYAFPLCEQQVAKDILDLITRQQVEIENLKVENQSLRSAANSLKMHYEEAQSEIERLNEQIVNVSKTIKSEAYKEIAERLKIEANNVYPLSSGNVFEITEQDIDNLVKEMVGD